MKFLSTLSFLLLSSTILFAQGIQFSDADFKEVLSTASKENKLIFVDAYTTWCGPCKQMSKNVFTDAAVGEFYNDNFINLKIDQEKGQGIAFQQSYDVKYFPTLIFLDGKGNLVHKAVGSMLPEEFITLGKNALDPDFQLKTLQEEYTANNISPMVLKNLANAMQTAYISGSENVSREYLETQKDWYTPENIAFITKHFPTDIDNKVFDFIVAEKELFEKEFNNPTELDNKLVKSVSNSLDNTEDKSDELINNIFERYFEENWEEKAAAYKIDALGKSKDPEDQKAYYEAKIAQMQSTQNPTWEALNALAWNIYENNQDVSYNLEAAQDFAAKSVALDKNYFNTDTYAWISEALGDKKNAKKYGKIAIKLGEADDADVSALKEMIHSL